VYLTFYIHFVGKIALDDVFRERDTLNMSIVGKKFPSITLNDF